MKIMDFSQTDKSVQYKYYYFWSPPRPPPFNFDAY